MTGKSVGRANSHSIKFATPHRPICTAFLSLSSLPLFLFFPENITRSPEFSRKYAYWKSPLLHTHIHRPSVPFQPKNRRERTGTPRANRKFESTFPAARRYSRVCISASPPFTCDYRGAVLLEICGKR